MNGQNPKRIAFFLMTYLALLTAAKSLKYITTDIEVFDPLFRFKYEAHLPVVLTHGVAAIAALVIGPFQFMPGSRRRWRRLHRVLGGGYILSVAVGGVTGLIMGTMAYGGLAAKFAFVLVACLWLISGWKAYSSARAGRIADHRVWMIRNYALTFGAVTLRVYLNLLQLAGLEFETIYVWVPWAAWAPNMVVGEWIIGNFRANHLGVRYILGKRA